MGGGIYSHDDFASVRADWVQPISHDAFNHRVWSIPAPSQGYLFLAALGVLDQIDLPDDTTDPQWAHLLIEPSRR